MSPSSDSSERLSTAQAELEIRANLDLAERTRFSVIAQAFIPMVLYFGGDYARDLPRTFTAVCIWWFLIATSRAFIMFRMIKASPARLGRLARYLHLNIALAPIGWGLFFAAAFSHYGPTDWNTYLVIMLILGIGAGTMATVVSHYLLLAFTITLCSLPILAGALLTPGRRAGALALSMLVYCVAILILGRRLNLNYWAGLRDNALLKVHMEELELARGHAEQASLAKSEFLANMGHELLTPMNGVLGMTELALDTTLSREQRDYLDLAHTSARTLLNLLNQLFDYSKIDAGHFQLVEAPFDLRSSLWVVLDERISADTPAGLKFELEVDPRIPNRVTGDEARLRQVLGNLLDNAVKFTEKGSILLTARLAPHFSLQPASVPVEFEVRDTGIGIPPEKCRDIFEAFVQADGSRSRRRGGLGLGLALSSGIIRLMGGRLSVESAPGAGSRFFFTVEFAGPCAPISEPLLSSASAGSAAGQMP